MAALPYVHLVRCEQKLFVHGFLYMADIHKNSRSQLHGDSVHAQTCSVPTMNIHRKPFLQELRHQKHYVRLHVLRLCFKTMNGKQMISS